jgi:TP901-1 family phage major tail protein
MGYSGRNVRWSRGGVQIAGARSDNLTVNAEPVDITDKDANGWRTLLADVGVRTVSGSVSGVMKNATLVSVMTGSATAILTSCEMEIGGIYAMTGNFHLSNLTVTGEQQDAVTFEAELQGSGTFVREIAPYAVTPGTITGTPQVGQVLSATNGTWAGDATITFFRPWQRSLDGISWSFLSSAATYTVVAGDVGYLIRRVERGTNSIGTSDSVSNILGPVTA